MIDSECIACFYGGFSKFLTADSAAVVGYLPVFNFQYAQHLGKGEKRPATDVQLLFTSVHTYRQHSRLPFSDCVKRLAEISYDI